MGTNRVWFTSDWGAHWVTLPNGVNDPRAGGVNNDQDALPAERGGIRVLRWATVDHLIGPQSRVLTMEKGRTNVPPIFSWRVKPPP